METYLSWVFRMSRKLEDAGYKYAILTAGYSSFGIAHRLMLSHIGDEMIMLLTEKSAFGTGPTFRKQHTERMKYRQVQMITELCAMNVGAHVALQHFWTVLTCYMQALQELMRSNPKLPSSWTCKTHYCCT